MKEALLQNLPGGRSRARLTLLLVSPALLVIVLAIAATSVFLLTNDAGTQDAAKAGLARVGDALAVVIVTGDGGAATIAGTRDLVVVWGLVLPAVALVPAAVAAWLLAGRVLRIIGRANSEVERADDERSNHLQEIVHELRTPLAVMGANLELASTKVDLDSGATPHIGAARRAVDRMARTVDDLDGHGRLSVEQEDGPVDLANLAAGAVAEHAGLAQAGGIHIVLTGAPSTMLPSADPAAVSAAIGNFLSNAVRFAPRGSSVTVDWGEVGDWAWLSVTDEGPGLAPHLHARVFERGWQGPYDRSRGSGSGGAGLGLTIARQLTEAQGGAVTLESEEGGGATLAMWLPLDHEANQDDVIDSDRVHTAIQPWRKDFQPA
ncbi:MAG TPA: HAMP domain-containing sensor histidine kinase [Acidimicrobiia bacterium]